MAEKTIEVAARNQQPPSTPSNRDRFETGPFRMLDRFADEIGRVFDDFGLGRTWLAPRWERISSFRTSGAGTWTPRIDIQQQNNELVVRADLPGLRKEDVHVDVTDESMTISGERREEHEAERGGIYRSERSYGTFLRTIPLPDGAIADQARATFKNGVLEIRLPAPPEQVTRGRRLDIHEGEEKK